MKKVEMSCLGTKKSLASLRLDTMAQRMVQHSNWSEPSVIPLSYSGAPCEYSN